MSSDSVWLVDPLAPSADRRETRRQRIARRLHEAEKFNAAAAAREDSEDKDDGDANELQVGKHVQVKDRQVNNRSVGMIKFP